MLQISPRFATFYLWMIPLSAAHHFRKEDALLCVGNLRTLSGVLEQNGVKAKAFSWRALSAQCMHFSSIMVKWKKMMEYKQERRFN
jgi:hypothetical protein